MPDEKKLFLLDAYALIFRAYYAFIRNPRINSKGFNTSAVFGFTTALLDVIKREEPTHLAVCFDFPAATVRNEIYPEYKANREETPEDIRASVPYIRDIIHAFNIPLLEAEGYEADDVIGTLAKKAASEGYTTYMVTPDKDFGQLVDDHIKMYKPAKSGNGPEVMDTNAICEQWGIDSTLQVIDILGLMGDSVDNIPGVPGVGPKTAAKLIKQYGSIEKLYENLDEQKGKLKENLENNREQAFLSKHLATILLDAPVDFDEEALIISDPDKDKLREIFTELEFRQLAQRVLGESIVLGQSVSAGGQMELFAQEERTVQTDDNLSDVASLQSIDHEYHLTESEDQIKALIAVLESSKRFCFDTETTGLDALSAELVGLAFSVKSRQAFYVPFPESQEKARALLDRFKAVLEDDSIEKIGHNLKYDILVLKKYDFDVKGPFFDTMIAHYLLEPDIRKRKMDDLAEMYLNYSPQPISELIGEKGKAQKSMREVDPEQVKEYAGEDADITLQLRHYFAPKIEESGNKSLLEDIESPLMSVLADMEAEGISLDTKSLERLSSELTDDLIKIEKEIHDLAGMDFKISSPRQVGEVLFDHLKVVEKAKKTKTGQYATSEDVLDKIRTKHPIIEKILNFRELQKLKNTYVDTLPKLIRPETGKIHTTFNQVVAATGRLSSDHPNLQNIPIRTERGREIRKAFVSRGKDYELMASDYSQIELRIMAEMSNDEGMIEAFVKGQDIHAATAAKVYGVELGEVDRTMRSNAKMVNFGIIYGISAFGLADRLSISRSEARDIIDSYFKQYPKVKEFMDAAVDKARDRGYVETVMGRKRFLRDINSANAIVRGNAERVAINAPIQGSAADLIKLAMIRIQSQMKKEKMRSKMLLQVHDELVFDVHLEEKKELQSMVEELMSSAIEMKVPLVVESGFGKNWLDAH
jgi:DNA polymerase-1